MRDDGVHSMFLRHADAVDGLRHGSDLIQFYQDSIRHSLINPHLQPFPIRHEQIITDQHYLVFQFFRQFFPSVEIVFRHTVFDRDDRVFFHPVFVQLYELRMIECLPFSFEDILTVFVEFRRCAIER